MKILKIDPKNRAIAIQMAITFLEKDLPIIIPTDTVYGLAANGMSEKALAALLKTKKREREKGFPLFVHSVEMARRLAYIDARKEKFLRAVWPGQVTVILQAKDIVSKTITGGRETVALRMPDEPFVIELIKKFGRPITGTSANVSGNTPIRSAVECPSQWKGRTYAPAAVFDAGTLGEHPPSAIVDITGAHPIILRRGVMKKEEFERMLALAK